MDVREKLVDDVHSKLMGLLQRTPYTRCEDVHRRYAVNWLMNNGVTVQEWISVKDRLPEQGQEVIVYSGGVLKPTVFAYQFWNKHYDSWARITHWMPLPQPPKGE